MEIGIISYLPENEDLRLKRKRYIATQISWLRSVFGPEKAITVVAQNYLPGDFLKDGHIDYIKSEPVGPGEARNILLRRFYRGDEPYFMIMDDDFVLYDYYGANNLLKEIESNPQKFFALDMIVGNNPLYLPFKKNNWKDRANMETHWKFKRSYVNSGMQIAVMKNAQKWWGKQYYFKDNRGIAFHEDVDFTIRWIIDGHTRYQCEAWQYKDMGHLASTLFTKERTEEHKWLENTLRSYPASWGIFKSYDGLKHGNFDYSYINNRNKTKAVGYIKRAERYCFTDQEKPKGV